MSQPIDERKSINREQRREDAPTRAMKKKYASPNLVEYGGIAKLTQTSAGSGTDSFGMMSSCL